MPRSRLELLPVVHTQSGTLVGPDGEPVRKDLRSVARDFKRQYGSLYLVDLGGIQRNKPDVRLLRDVAGASPVWVDAGSRFHTDVMDLMVAGAEQVTIRYQTARDRDMVEETVRVTEHVALAMEFQDDKLVQNPRWPATPDEVRRLAQRYRLPVVVIDLDKAGRAEGIERSVAWHGRQYPHGAYFAGGVAKERDLEVLADLGYRGALVSTALLQGADLDGDEWAGPPGLADEEDQGGLP